MKESEQMMMPEQLRSHLRKSVEETTAKVKKGDDDMLLSLAESDGWKLLMNIVERTNEALTARTKQLVGKATSWEEVAKIYFARDVAVDSVKAITDVVQLRLNASKADEGPDKPKEE